MQLSFGIRSAINPRLMYFVIKIHKCNSMQRNLSIIAEPVSEIKPYENSSCFHGN